MKVIINDCLPIYVYNVYSALPFFRFRNFFLIFHILKEESQGRFKQQVIKTSFLSLFFGYYNIGAEFRNMVIFFEQENISKFYVS